MQKQFGGTQSDGWL